MLSALFALSSVYGQGGGGPATTPVPTRINFQGRVAVDNVNFEGNGQFKFALISTQAGTSTVVWTNDGSNLGTLTAPATGEPAHYVTLPVAGGLYSLMLGDTTVINDGAIAMPELLPAVAASLGVQPQSHLQLRVWFNDGPHGFQLLAPDQKLTSVVYAFRAAEAANVSDGAITAAKMANGAVGSAQLAAGSVGSTHLQGGAVGAANIADGAVGSTQIANASITVPKLNLGVLQGTALDGTLSGLSGATTTFITTYSPPFVRTPNVVLSSGWSISSSSQTGFSATRPSMVPSVRASNGDTPNILSVNGFPAISFRDASVNRINFVRATSADGSSWGTPIVVDNSVGSYVTNSMAIINGNPTIAYYDGGQSTNTLYFVRATNANGSAWGTRVLVPMAGYGGFLSVTTVSGRPAIAASNGQFLSYIRANDANGTSWGTPVQLTNNSVTGDHCSLCMISGNPAVSYRGTNGQLFYVRANDTAGLTWGSPIAVGPSARVFYTTLKEIEGRPAIAYYELTGGPTEKLKYVRASDTTGASWPTPTQLDTGSGVGPFPSLTTLGGKPVIAYKGTGGMRVLLSTDSTGGSWAASLLVDATSGATAIAEINGNLSIAYCNPAGQSTLKYTTLPTLNWSASDGTISPLVAAQVASGAVGAEQIVANSISGMQVVDGTIGNADIGTNAVGSSQLLDGSVTTAKMADASVTNAKLAIGSVGTQQIQLGAVRSNEVLDGSLDTVDLANNAITSAKIATDAVTTAKIAAGAVTSAKIAAGAVTAQEIAVGAVGTAQIALGAVTSTSIAAGAVTSQEIADGAITASKIPAGSLLPSHFANPPQAGSIAIPPLFIGGPTSASVSQFFPSFYGTPPIVTASVSGNEPGDTTGLTTTVSKVTATGFTVTSTLSQSTVLNADNVIGAEDSGSSLSLAIISGRPAICYEQHMDATTSELVFVRSDNPTGSAWSATPVVVEGPLTGDVGMKCSMAAVSGAPAIAYAVDSPTATTLKFVRSPDAVGSSWGAPVSIATLAGGPSFTENLAISLLVVNGNPAIAYRDPTTTELKYVRATDTIGSAWGAPLSLDNSDDMGYSASLKIVNGNPAIAYDGEGVHFVRANDASGTSWGSPQYVAGGGLLDFHLSLAVVNGNPAIAFTNLDSDVRYVRASDSSGSTWGSAITIDASRHLSTSSRGTGLSLAVIGGVPSVSYGSFEGVEGNLSLSKTELKYATAQDASGGAWNSPFVLQDSVAIGGLWETMLVENQSLPAIAFGSVGAAPQYQGRVKFFRPASGCRVNWIALPQ